MSAHAPMSWAENGVTDPCWNAPMPAITIAPSFSSVSSPLTVSAPCR